MALEDYVKLKFTGRKFIKVHPWDIKSKWQVDDRTQHPWQHPLGVKWTLLKPMRNKRGTRLQLKHLNVLKAQGICISHENKHVGKPHG